MITDRQYEILNLLSNGYSGKQVADRLGIDIKTVEKHGENMREKTGAKNIAHLVRIGFETGLLKAHEPHTRCDSGSFKNHNKDNNL